MANWDDGYVTDVPYVPAYHREALPMWIATASTILGNAAPDISRPFRYADLGCGSGVTSIIVAATMPHAEVWAYDFNPYHIADGREIARRAGLTNIRFVEASFEDLTRQGANAPSNEMGDAVPIFDFIVAHGILSWISHTNQRHLYSVIGQRLAPGGIAYVSYNVATGWSGVRPIATLMRLLAEATPRRPDLALASVFDTLEELRDAGAAMFADNPVLGARVAGFRTQNQRYVAHELLNGHWRPLMFQTVATEMARLKCDYICSATLQDNIMGLTVPAALHQLFGEANDIRLRETLRDLSAGAAFRRDLYQRGARPMTPREHRRRTDAITLTRGFQPIPETITLEAAVGPVNADQSRFRAVLGALESGPTTIGQLRQDPTFAGWPDAALLEAVTLLISNGYVTPMQAEPPEAAAIAAAAQLNQVHAALFEQGEDRPWLACPALGAAWLATPFELMALDEMRAGRAAEVEPLVDAVLDRVARTGRQMLLKDQSVASPAQLREMVADVIRDLLRRLPAMRRLGALEPLQPAAAREPPASG